MGNGKKDRLLVLVEANSIRLFPCHSTNFMGYGVATPLRHTGDVLFPRGRTVITVPKLSSDWNEGSNDEESVIFVLSWADVEVRMR